MNSRELTQQSCPKGIQKDRAEGALWESSVPLKEPDKPKVIWTRVLVLCKNVTTTSSLLIESRLTPCVCGNPACPKGTLSREWWMVTVVPVCVGNVTLGVYWGLFRTVDVQVWAGFKQLTYERLWLLLPLLALSDGIHIVQQAHRCVTWPCTMHVVWKLSLSLSAG